MCHNLSAACAQVFQSALLWMTAFSGPSLSPDMISCGFVHFCGCKMPYKVSLCSLQAAVGLVSVQRLAIYGLSVTFAFVDPY